MALGSFNSPGTQMPTAEINMTPLVDVMLVLLIIFIITAPLMTHQVKVDLPKAASTPTPEKPLTLQVSITGENIVYVGNDLHAYFVTGARVSVTGDAKVLPMKKA